MIKTTFVTAFILMAPGCVGYLTSETQSPTALIPAVIGLLLFACALTALSERRRALAMHLAAMVALIGFVGAALRLPKSGAALTQMHVDALPLAFMMQSMMALACFLHLALAIRSFAQARRSNKKP